jgi:L-histidine Nalpha-methyltransferase
MNDFYNDVSKGLSATPKYIPSQYFYDDIGDALFREIMDCDEYYLTRCEMEIFMAQGREIAAEITKRSPGADVVELGAGDCSKSVHLLHALAETGGAYSYFPIDISTDVISKLEQRLPGQLPGVAIHGLNGEYFAMLEQLRTLSSRPLVVLFLGSNIGNVPLNETGDFLKRLRSFLRPGDLLLTGFDLVKDPSVIRAAYNDKGGITARFNLNLLSRVNRELHTDIDVSAFGHLPEYDETTGTCSSSLVSLKQQVVRLGDREIHFEAGEAIHTEVSQKYTRHMIDELASGAGFQTLQYFHDARRWFVDVLWVAG